MEFRQLVQAKITQPAVNTESSAGSKDVVHPAKEKRFTYRKLRQYFR